MPRGYCNPKLLCTKHKKTKFIKETLLQLKSHITLYQGLWVDYVDSILVPQTNFVFLIAIPILVKQNLRKTILGRKINSVI